MSPMFYDGTQIKLHGCLTLSQWLIQCMCMRQLSRFILSSEIVGQLQYNFNVHMRFFVVAPGFCKMPMDFTIMHHRCAWWLQLVSFCCRMHIGSMFVVGFCCMHGLWGAVWRSTPMSYTSSWRGRQAIAPTHKFGAWLLELELHGNSCACEFVHARGTPAAKFARGGYSGRA